MTKRRFKILISFSLLMLMSIGLTVSTLHSHHNLDLHNSADFADTGHCLNTDTTLCPICAQLIKTDTPSNDLSGTVFQNIEEVIPTNSGCNTSFLFEENKGRSPPSIA